MLEGGRWTDILMKKDGKWMLFGDHGGEVDDDWKLMRNKKGDLNSPSSVIIFEEQDTGS